MSFLFSFDPRRFPRIPYVAESDARHGGFDFRAAHEAAPPDLQRFLDQHESLVSEHTLCRQQATQDSLT